MKKAVIIYESKTGITKKYSLDIANFVKSEGFETQLFSIHEYSKESVDKADLVFLGCWTSGLFICLQGPNKQWIDFAKKIEIKGNKKIVFFTTYKLLTGSMFRKMKKYIKNDNTLLALELKSKNGILTENDKTLLLELINK